jgi:hypothetical protein
MKRIILAVAAHVLFAPLLHAEVFIYKNKISYNVTGAGGVDKLKGAGWTIINEFGDITQVLAFPAQRQFAIIPLQSIDYNTVDAGGGKTYSFFIQHDVWNDGNGNTHIDTGGAKGLNVNTTVKGTLWSIPKTWNWGGRSMYPADSSGTRKFEESTGTLAFDKKWTQTSNDQSDDISAAAQRLADSLLSSGYTEF